MGASDGSGPRGSRDLRTWQRRCTLAGRALSDRVGSSGRDAQAGRAAQVARARRRSTRGPSISSRGRDESTFAPRCSLRERRGIPRAPRARTRPPCAPVATPRGAPSASSARPGFYRAAEASSRRTTSRSGPRRRRAGVPSGEVPPETSEAQSGSPPRPLGSIPCCSTTSLAIGERRPPSNAARGRGPGRSIAPGSYPTGREPPCGPRRPPTHPPDAGARGSTPGRREGAPSSSIPPSSASARAPESTGFGPAGTVWGGEGRARPASGGPRGTSAGAPGIVRAE